MKHVLDVWLSDSSIKAHTMLAKIAIVVIWTMLAIFLVNRVFQG